MRCFRVAILVMILATMALLPGACCAADLYTLDGTVDVAWTDGAWVGPPGGTVTTDIARQAEGETMELVATDLPYVSEGMVETYRDLIAYEDAGKDFQYFIRHVAKDAEGTVIVESDWCMPDQTIARIGLTPPTGCGVLPGS